MSKNRKRLMRSSLVMLIVAAVALSSATYAWFSSANAASLTEVEFTATASSGIQISADAETWKASIDAAAITTEIAVGATGAQKGRTIAYADLTPASSVGAVTSGAMALFAGSVDTSTGTTFTSSDASQAVQGSKSGTTVSKGTAGGYYVFDLYFLNSGSKVMTLKLDVTATGGSTVVGKTGNISGIENATRIAFVDQGAAATKTLAIALIGGTSSVIWEPNAKSHTERAKSEGRATATTEDSARAYKGIQATGKTGDWDGYVVNNASSGDAIVAAVTPATAVTNATTSKDEITITELETGINKITVYIWIEGQDVDCTNAESGGTVLTNLKFTAVEKTTT